MVEQVNPITREQLLDADVVGEVELASSGYTGAAFQSGLTVVTADAGTSTITIAAGDLSSPIVSPGDLILIIGGAAAGKYTVDTVPTMITIAVVEVLPDANSGQLDIFYPAGARITGFDNDTNGFTATTVQAAIEEVNAKTANSGHFSYKKIAVGQTIIIPDDQQMATFGDITIDGTLQIDGEFYLGNY